MDAFTAIADPTRRAIVELLAQEGTLTATSIGNRFNMSLPAVSQHLKVLRESGLVSVEKRGRERLYTVEPEAMREIGMWANRLADQWESRFDKLDVLLAREQANQGKEGKE